LGSIQPQSIDVNAAGFGQGPQAAIRILDQVSRLVVVDRVEKATR
jgi:ribosomal protein S11